MSKRSAQTVGRSLVRLSSLSYKYILKAWKGRFGIGQSELKRESFLRRLALLSFFFEGEWMKATLIVAFNPLWTKFFLSSFFGTWFKIGSFRLPTHRRDAHRNFFWWSLLKIEMKFRWKGTPVSSWALKGQCSCDFPKEEVCSKSLNLSRYFNKKGGGELQFYLIKMKGKEMKRVNVWVDRVELSSDSTWKMLGSSRLTE